MFNFKSFRSVEEANFHYFVLDIAWFGIAFVSTSRFLSVYAIRIGASPAELSLLVSLPGIVLLAASSLSIYWRNRYPDTRHAQQLPGLGFRLIFLLPAFTPLFPKDWQPWWLILSVTLPAIPQGIAAVLFMALMRESVPSSRMTALFSRRITAVNCTLALGSLAYGFWLEKAPFPQNYQIMFLIAFVASLVSLWYVNRVRPQTAPTHDVRAAVRGMVSPWRNPRFQKVLVITGLSYIAFFSVMALNPLRLVKELGASEGHIAAYSLIELIAAAVGAYFARKVADHWGSLSTVGMAMACTAIGTLVVAFAPFLLLAMFSAVLIGAGWAAADMALQSYFSLNTPKEDATRYSTAYLQIVSVAIFVGPLIGSALASANLELSAVLGIGAGLRLLAGMVTLSMETMRHYRPVPHPAPSGSGD